MATEIPYRPRADLLRPPVTFDVRVSGEKGLIWQGSLRVGTASANVTQGRSEAQAAGCPTDMRLSLEPLRSSFLLSLARGYGEDDLYGITVNWTRVPGEDGCAREGTRMVQLQSSIRIPEHGSATLHGDAGLTVELHRR
jgi:hypothetical protein